MFDTLMRLDPRRGQDHGRDGVTRPRAQLGRLRSTVGDFPDEADVEVITPRDDAIAVQLKDAHHLRRSDLAAVSGAIGTRIT